MKRLLWMVMILLSMVSLASAIDMSHEVQKQGQDCANALISHDITHILQYTHPVVIQMSGGKQGFISAFDDAVREMKNHGLEFAFVDVEEPTLIKYIKDNTYAVLPQTITMTAPGGMLISTGYLLAVSSNDGKDWRFADMAPLTNENIGSVFPDLINNIVVPEQMEPTFIPYDSESMSTPMVQADPL